MTKAKTDKLVQVELVATHEGIFSEEEATSTTHMICMVEARPDIKVKNKITLKDFEDPNLVWEIVTVSRPISKYAIHTDWNNNI